MENLKDYIEELAAFRRTSLLKYRNEVGAVIQMRIKVMDFYKEEEVYYIITDAGIRINLNAVLEIDNISQDNIV